MTKQSAKKNIILVLIILAIISFIIISPQIYKRSITLGTDVMFHFNRFFEVAEQLKTGRFNYFQSLYGFNSTGRVVNAFYGWDFSFILGFLLYLVKTWAKFQIISSFLCMFIAGVNMYFLSKYVKICNTISVVTAILYMSSNIIVQYSVAQAFNSWGSAFLPLIFIPAIKAIRDKEEPVAIIALALTTSLLLSVHMMSLVIALLAIIPFYLYSFIKTKRKLNWVYKMLATIVLASLLSANSIIGFLDLYLSNNILQPFHSEQMSGDILRFLVNRNDLHDVGLVYTSLFIFTIFYLIFNWRESRLEEKFIVITGSIFLLLSSGILPWDEMPKLLPMVKTFQFPYRFGIISYVLLLLGFALVVERSIKYRTKELKKLVYTLMTTLSFLCVMNANAFINSQSWVWQSDDPTAGGNNKSSVREKNPEQLREAFKDTDLEKGLHAIIKGTPDYLPISKNDTIETIYKNSPYEQYLHQFVDNPLKVSKTVTKQGELALSFTNESKKYTKIQLPVVIYNHSTVEVNNQKIVGKKETTNLGALIVNAKPGENTIVVGYHSRISMKLAFLLKLIGIVVVFVIYHMKKKGDRKTG